MGSRSAPAPGTSTAPRLSHRRCLFGAAPLTGALRGAEDAWPRPQPTQAVLVLPVTSQPLLSSSCTDLALRELPGRTAPASPGHPLAPTPAPPSWGHTGGHPGPLQSHLDGGGSFLCDDRCHAAQAGSPRGAVSWGSPSQTPFPQRLGGSLASWVCRRECSRLFLNGSDGFGRSLICTKPLVSRDLPYLIWICYRVLPPSGLPSSPRSPQIARTWPSPAARAASTSAAAQTWVLARSAAAHRHRPRTGAQSAGSSTQELQKPLST